ncbi:amphi-Trp domain-containing protein [Rhodococcus opacus]|uniref:Amphi-Trp domain-containing protein n=1 Tax=Rhodococcus opacus TaxID=37919 RepID=A0A2S8JIZ9_RHOOP|nr:amphi-Trp domain-containing protein [Rhodococcus opacus]PQP26602.1 amphi-Trp domain-containing protein [Rhodococcus opacus]
MPKLEIKRKSELSRKEVSDRLIALGRALASGSEVELGSGGDSISVVVGDRVQWELEIEVDGDETEIEIEISWRDDRSEESTADAEPESETPPVKTAPPAKTTARRGRPRKSTAK